MIGSRDMVMTGCLLTSYIDTASEKFFLVADGRIYASEAQSLASAAPVTYMMTIGDVLLSHWRG